MTIGRIEVDLSGLDRSVKSAIRAGADLRPVWKGLRSRLRKDQSDHLRNQKALGGGPFRSLASATVESRLRKISRRKKNFTKRGKLRRPAQRRLNKILSAKLLRWARVKATRRSISIFGRGRLAHFHQGGGNAGPGSRVKVPGRPWMYIDDKFARIAFRRVSVHVAAAFERPKGS